MYRYNNLTKAELGISAGKSRRFEPKKLQATIMSILIVFLIMTVILTSYSQADQCLSKTYGDGRTVCVCNAQYCDKILKPDRIEPPQYLIYTSNRAGLRFQKQTGQFGRWPKAAALVTKIIVDGKTEFQKILGWGGAFTDSTGINIKSLDEGAQHNLLKSYFADDGIEYNLCRVPIGGTDFSTRAYSYDDGSIDRALTNFNLTSEDFDYKIPYIKKARQLTGNNLKLFASAWTAPKWMKTNKNYAGLGFLQDDMYQTWADYFVKFLDSYKSEGIDFWGITTGNEPSLGFLPFGKINSVAWLPNQMSKWVSNNLGPTLRNSSYRNIKIMALDDQRFFLPWYLNKVFASNATKNYIDGIAVHWYYDNIAPVTLLDETHTNFPDKFILGTEACNGDKPFQDKVILGSWDRGESYADDIIHDLLHWVSGWLDWNMALDLSGGPTYINNNVDSPIIVNSTAGEFYKQPTFYALGHFSKFIPRDSVVINSKSYNINVPVVALKRPDGGRVVVILNKSDAKVSVTLDDNLRGNTQFDLSTKSINSIMYW